MHHRSLASINAIIAATNTKRTLTISQVTNERFRVSLEHRRVELARVATSPRLIDALAALEYLNDGENVELDLSGNIINGKLPSRLWPIDGLRAVTLEKYG
jgi:hypothetical protein